MTSRYAGTFWRLCTLASVAFACWPSGSLAQEGPKLVEPAPEVVVRPVPELLPPLTAEASPIAVPVRTPTDWSGVVKWDSGRSPYERRYRSAEDCRMVPCVLTQEGALKFDLGGEDYDMELWTLHNRFATRIDFFEKRSAKDYLFLERVLHRRRNRKMWSLTDRIEDGDFDTMHIYGITRQYKFDGGDPLVLEIWRRDDPRDRRTYYFRFHRRGWRWHLDIGLILPINQLRIPAPEPDFRLNKLNAAATLQLARERDPAKEKAFWESLGAAIHPTLFAGPVGRKLQTVDAVQRTDSDLFMGAGITFMRFVFLGWGSTVFRKPRISAPFVGVHLRYVFGFIGELNRRSPEKWDEYMENENKKRIFDEAK